MISYLLKMSKEDIPLMEEAIHNIREDRNQTKELLKDLVKYISGAEERHKESGLIAAKYVETLQRSNDQLVKIVSLRHKNINDDSKLSNQERNEIFDELNGE